MLSQDKGIADIEAITSLRREAQKLIKNLFSDKKIEFIEIPADKAAYLVQEAAARTEQQTGIVSPTMVQWKTLFGDIIPADSLPPVYQLYSADAIRADTALLRESEKLLEHTEIPFWFIVTDCARSMWQQYSQVGDTASAEAFPQDSDREAALMTDTADRFFTSEQLKKFRRRLEELAYIFHIKGNTELAQIAFAQALNLESQGGRPSENSFCSSIIQKGLSYFKSYAAKKAGGSPA